MAKNKSEVVKVGIPTMLYKYPGKTEEIHGLGCFDYLIVDESEVDSFLEEGYFKTTVAAKEAHENKEGESLKVENDDLKAKLAATESDKKSAWTTK